MNADPPSSAAFDLDAYLSRIGLRTRPAADLDGLRTLHHLHPQAIAFENLDPLQRLPVQLDIASLQAKLVHGGRGGWCFEHNLLFMHALRALGFAVLGLSARVLWNRTDPTPESRSHMLLKVRLDDTDWMADVGFGGLTLTAPLRLHSDGAQATPHEPARLQAIDGGFRLDVELPGEWKPLYRFDLQPQEAADYGVSNWYLGHHPQSQFIGNLMAARAAPGCRHALRNNQFSTQRPGEPAQRRVLASVSELRAVLQDTFGLRLPPPGSEAGAVLDAALGRLLS